MRRRENRCLLSIVNCSKDDEATYECKVTQGDATTKCVLNCDGRSTKFTVIVTRKPVFGVFGQVLHKLGCTATEDGQRPEISDLGSRGIVLSM